MASFLHRAAVNAALDLVRSRQNIRNIPLDELEPVLAEPAHRSPDRAQSSSEIRDWLRGALARLNPRIAQMFALRFFEGRDNPEIARLLNTTPGTVAVTLVPHARPAGKGISSLRGRCRMTPAEFNPMDPELEKAVQEIRDDAPDPAVVEAAAARVWARLAEAAALLSHEPIRTCADFQALLPDYRAGRLPRGARDPAERPPARMRGLPQSLRRQSGRNARRGGPSPRQPHGALGCRCRRGCRRGPLGVGGPDQFGGRTGRAIVQAVNGTLYEVSAAGIRPLAAGQDLPDGVELRTAKDSDAMLQLHDGSVVELRERSGFSTTQTASDLTIRLGRGSIIVQAAKRRSRTPVSSPPPIAAWPLPAPCSA